MKTNSLTLRKLGIALVIATLAGGIPLTVALAGTAAGDPEAWNVSVPEQPGAITLESVVYEAFRNIGWKWGGELAGRQKDFMHFSLSGD